MLRIGAAAPLAGAALIGTARMSSANPGYSWSGALSTGSEGPAVEQLQMRVAGYPDPSFGSTLLVDGIYGSGTAAAVERFQVAYGLSQDGIAGEETYGQIYDLQTADNFTTHFTLSEYNQYNVAWGGRSEISAARRRRNATITVWKLEALRRNVGQALLISSSIRNNDVSAGSRHIYGDAVDISMIGGNPVVDGGYCGSPNVALAAREHGFREILGPGHDAAHADHLHFAEYVLGTSQADAGAAGNYGTLASHSGC